MIDWLLFEYKIEQIQKAQEWGNRTLELIINKENDELILKDVFLKVVCAQFNHMMNE